MSLPIKVEPLTSDRSWVALQTLQYRSEQDFPLDRYYYGLVLEIPFRVAIGVAAADAEFPESPQGILESCIIRGQHRFRNTTDEIINLRGASAFAKFGTIYKSRVPSVTAQQGVAVGNKDHRIFIPIIFPPQKVFIAQQPGYLLDAPNYEWLEMVLQFGDGTSLYDPAPTTTFTFSGFGGVGNPLVRVHRLVPNLQSERFGLVTGLCRHYFNEVTGSQMTTTANGVRLFDVKPGNKYRAFLTKTGVKSVVSTAGLNPFASLSDTILANFRLMRNRVAQREFRSYLNSREYLAEAYAATVPQGYAGFEFCEFGDIRDAYDTQNFVTDNIASWIEADVTGVAAQAMEVLIEEIVGEPVQRQ